MNYFYDTEFLEGTQKKRFGKTPPTIDLISIGIISDDGREYYAISKDFNLKEAWNRYDKKVNRGYPYGPEYFKEYWIRDNVLKPIFRYYLVIENDKEGLNGIHINTKTDFTYKTFKYLIGKYGKSNKQIAFEVLNFLHGNDDIGDWIGTLGDYYNMLKRQKPKEDITLYGYYSGYDHVAFCWLFGKMIDLPKGFPMYTRDLRQILDEKAEQLIPEIKNNGHQLRYDGVQPTLDGAIAMIKRKGDYPKQENEHSAVDDARWNKKLYEFLTKL